MQYQEISLEELIHYLEGSATESTRKQIDHELKSNPDFVEEFEGWEAFLKESTSREAGIAKMKSFSTAWTETKIDTSVIEPEAKVLQFDAPDLQQKSTASNRPMFFKIAIAACILLLAGVIISNLMQGPSMLEQVNQGIAQEMEIILSPMAGNTLEGMEKYDVFLAGLLSQKKYGKVASSIDSLLAIHPNESKYQHLQAMNSSLKGEDGEAISIISSLLKETDHTPEFACKLQVNLAMIYAKAGKKEAFEKTLDQLKSNEKYGYACTELDASILKKLIPLSTNL